MKCRFSKYESFNKKWDSEFRDIKIKIFTKSVWRAMGGSNNLYFIAFNFLAGFKCKRILAAFS